MAIESYPSRETIERAWMTHAESKLRETCAMNGDEAAKAQADYVPVNCQELLDSSNPSNSTGLEMETVLEEAARITSADRNKSYGPPRDNHSRTAALWTAYLSAIGCRPLDYRDVCWLNVLQKASRDAFCPKRDNLTDAIGFLRNIEMADNDEGR